MNQISRHILTPLFHFYMLFMIVLFYPVQVLARRLYGEHLRRRSVDLLNLMLIKGLHIMGTRMVFSGFENMPEDRPLIIVSNHQSMYDIPAVGWAFRQHHPKFIAKKELAQNTFSIAYNLRHGKSALIDRKNGSQSIREIFKLGKLIENNNYAVCIFPEGTRSRTGKVGAFMSAGLETLLRAAPSALVVPFVIDGHNRLMNYGKYPLQFGTHVSYKVLPPLEPADFSSDELTARLKELISGSLVYH
ncbi:MAG: lysophospholipid acyltransferase family protein [Marinilabilia sp.]